MHKLLSASARPLGEISCNLSSDLALLCVYSSCKIKKDLEPAYPIFAGFQSLSGLGSSPPTSPNGRLSGIYYGPQCPVAKANTCSARSASQMDGLEIYIEMGCSHWCICDEHHLPDLDQSTASKEFLDSHITAVCSAICEYIECYQ